MDDKNLFLTLATVALCTIVGIYYIWVRKRPGAGGEPRAQA